MTVSNFVALAGLAPGQFLSIAARYQADGSLVATQIWASGASRTGTSPTPPKWCTGIRLRPIFGLPPAAASRPAASVSRRRTIRPPRAPGRCARRTSSLRRQYDRWQPSGHEQDGDIDAGQRDRGRQEPEMRKQCLDHRRRKFRSKQARPMRIALAGIDSGRALTARDCAPPSRRCCGSAAAQRARAAEPRASSPGAPCPSAATGRAGR